MIDKKIRTTSKFICLSSLMLSFFCSASAIGVPVTVDVPEVLAEQMIWESYATRTMAAHSNGTITLDDGSEWKIGYWT